MKIGYIVRGDPRPSIWRKVRSQVQHLNEIPDCSAQLYVYSLSNQRTPSAQIPDANYFYFSTPIPYLRVWAFRRRVFQHLLQLASDEKYDVFYIRGIPNDPFAGHFLDHCPVKVVFEINSVQLYERLLQKRPWLGWYEELFARKALPKAAGFIGVSSSVRDYYAKLTENKVSNIAQGNGFEVNSLPLRLPPEFDGKNVKIIVTANLRSWHGIDRVIAGLAAYKGDLHISLSIVGTGPAWFDLKSQVRKFHVADQVSFLGELYGDRLDELFSQAHLALGALAIHRIMLENATSIKVREYLSRGIPFLISYLDDDLIAMPEHEHFYLKVPADDSPVDFSILEPVAHQMLADPGIGHRMRKYALEHINMDKKMLELVSFLRRI